MSKYKHTSTKNLVDIINQNPDSIEKIEMQCDKYEVEEIKIEDFKRDLLLLSQSGFFSDSVEWRYEVVSDSKIIVHGYIDLGTQLRVYFKADTDMKKKLSKTIFDKLPS